MQQETRKNNVTYTPITSMEQTLGQEFQKGEISGIYTALNLLELSIEALEAERSERNFDEIDEDA